MQNSDYYTVHTQSPKEQIRILSKSRETIQRLVSKTVLDLGCGLEPILGEKTICVDCDDYSYHYKNKNIEFQKADILSPDFFENNFLKKEINYVTMNAVICNLFEWEHDGEKWVTVNLYEIITMIKNFKKIVKNNVIIGEGEPIKEILIKSLDNIAVKDIYAQENKIERYKKAYLIVV